MPDCPIIDTHVHLWDPAQLSYSWLAHVPIINRPMLLDAFAEATREVEIAQMVFLECGVDAGLNRAEAAMATSLAAQDARIGAIVAAAPVEEGAAARDELAELADRNPLLHGVRRILQDEADPRFALNDDFVAGVRRLAEFDLHFEMCIKGDDQLRSMAELAQRCPDVRFVLDHIGKPFIREKRMQPWGGIMRELAKQRNVWCKVSGVITEADHASWEPQDIGPYVRHAIESFGIDRCMFGGDWPVVTLAGSYQRWISALDEILASHSSGERAKLYHENARAFYRLD